MDEGSLKRVVSLILRHPIWNQSEKHIIHRLAKLASVQEMVSGQSILKAGTTAEEIHLLVEGQVRVFYVSKDGQKETTVKLLKAPAAFGESESILQTKRSTNVSAMSHAILLEFPAGAYFRILQECPSASFRQFWDLGRRFGVAMSTERQANVAELEERLAMLFASYAEHFGQTLPDGSVRISNGIDIDTLAEALGSTPRTVTRALGTLYKKGVLERRGRDFVVPNLEKLQELASQDGVVFSQNSTMDIWALKNH